jgi:hypothetical protein
MGPFFISAQAGAAMSNDPPFDPNNAWWPNPGWPRCGSLGGPYPDDWTDPFINPRPIAPAAIASFLAAQLGAMAWHPLSRRLDELASRQSPWGGVASAGPARRFEFQDRSHDRTGLA